MSVLFLTEQSLIFEFAEPQDVSNYVNKYIGRHCIVITDYRGVRASLSHRALADLDLCRITYGGSVRVSSAALNDVYHIQILLHGSCLWRIKGQCLRLQPGELIVINPDDPVDLTYSEDCEKFILKVPLKVLEDVCVEQRWAYPKHGIRFIETFYHLADIEGLAALLAMMCKEAESENRTYRVDKSYQYIFAAKMLSLLKSNVLRTNQDATIVAMLEKIDSYIDGNMDVRIEELADLAGVSVRVFYTLFERHVGVSPKRYIRGRRLDRVRECLADSACNIKSITELAFDYGFAHLGRFANSYRDRFGELPSETLMRRA
ncbi:AraC family transcriptional regulator [Pseudomonas veronii]|uniref:AraC family transcriptional regulator n=1 Tax=Pseudomonas veronii TaxID=76761 RepID=UPI000F823E87|nr:AraC family transcriptional regulator [Pseudomonas veronii]RTY78690.1 AraC family transcriptional regulator [Pseudomonas veronii]